MSLTYQDAYDNLVTNVYNPVFFGKLASAYGIQPADQAEATHLLNLAGKLRQAEAANQQKVAASRQGFLAGANDDLDRVLKSAGVVSHNKQNTQQDYLIKTASEQLLADEKLKDAALAYGDFLSQVAAQGK